MLPVGVPIPLIAVTVLDNVTDCPKTIVVGETVRVVEVGIPSRTTFVVPEEP